MLHKNSNEIKEVYNSRYEKLPGDSINQREIHLYSKYIKLMHLSFPKDYSLLDIGCGLGHKTIAAAEGASYVLGIDLSEVAVNKAFALYGERENLNFVAADLRSISEKFDFITAFGFSLLNEADIQTYLIVVKEILKNNLIPNKGNSMIIGSHTDFSGGNKSSWYYHTRSDLDQIKAGIQAFGNFNVRFVFPHKMIRNYFSFGSYNLFAECYKLLKFRRKTYFIIIEHG